MAFLRWQALLLDRRHRSACHHLTVFLVSSLLPFPWNPAVGAYANIPAVEAGGVLEVQGGCSGSVLSLLAPCVPPIWQCGPSSRQGRADNPQPPARGKAACSLTVAGDDAPGGRSTVNHNRSSKQDFWWLCSYYPLWWQMAQTRISPGCLFSSWVRRFPEQSIYEKLNTGKWQCYPTGSPPDSRQLKIKFSSLSSVSPAFN